MPIGQSICSSKSALLHLSHQQSQRKDKEELSDSFFGDTQEEKVTVSNREPKPVP